MPAHAWWNLLLPGSGLLAEGRPLPGGLLAVAAVLVAAVAAGASLVAPEGAEALRLRCVAGWCALALAAVVAQSLAARRQRIDPVRVRALHREAAAAWLTGRDEQARQAARLLCAAAPEEPGAWRLAALFDRGAGRQREAEAAERRAAAIERRLTAP